MPLIAEHRLDEYPHPWVSQEDRIVAPPRKKGPVMADAWNALEKLLAELGESAQFVTSGSLSPVLPGLNVEGVGSIGAPASAADAERLIIFSPLPTGQMSISLPYYCGIEPISLST